MKFIWDENKNKVNISKHGIDFIEATTIFNYPMIFKFDGRFDYGEERWIGYGLLGVMTVAVIFTEPEQNVIRIISARKATKNETKDYEKKIKNRLEKT